MRAHSLLLVASILASAHGLRPAAPHGLNPAASRGGRVQMGPRSKTRRQVLQGDVSDFDSTYKAFAKAGGGEATLFIIAGAIAAYGGSQRSGLFDQVAALDAGQERNSRGTAAEHLPTVSFTRSKAIGKVEVAVAVPPTDGPNDIDFMWLKDAGTGSILSVKNFKPEDVGERRPALTTLVPSGTRVVALTSGRAFGLWEGAAATATR